MPLVSRTRATLRSAEFGFFGVWVNTRTQTPRFCGLFCSAGLLVLLTIFLRPFRTSWLIVGIRFSLTACENAECGCTCIQHGAFCIAHPGVPRRLFRPKSLAAWRLKT